MLKYEGSGKLKVKQLEKILKQDGWYLYDIVGSHYQYKHNIKKGKITIPRHNKDMKIGTIKNILKQANINIKI